MELSENAKKVVETVKKYEEADVVSFIQKNIAAGVGSISEEALTEKLLSDPENIQWFYDGGYYYYEHYKDMYRDHKRRFDGFRKFMNELLETKSACARELNELAG